MLPFELFVGSINSQVPPFPLTRNVQGAQGASNSHGICSRLLTRAPEGPAGTAGDGDGPQAVRLMFWWTWKKFAGSYWSLAWINRS
jgi:hypothetical protein